MRINLKDFREAHRLSQADMAKILGLNQSNVSRSELRGFLSLTFPQKNILYEKFGQEDVESFEIKNGITVDASRNNIKGNGILNKGVLEADSSYLDVIRRQNEIIATLVTQQTEQAERMLALMEKLSNKL